MVSSNLKTPILPLKIMQCISYALKMHMAQNPYDTRKNGEFNSKLHKNLRKMHGKCVVVPVIYAFFSKKRKLVMSYRQITCSIREVIVLERGLVWWLFNYVFCKNLTILCKCDIIKLYYINFELKTTAFVKGETRHEKID